MSVVRAILCVAIMVQACASGLLADQFYVAREAAGASDSNDGLSPVFVSGNHGPWETLQYAAYTAQAGDTVTVHAGDYRNEATGWGGPGYIGLTNSGNVGNPIQFVAANGEQAFVQRFRLENVSWIEISGFEIESTEFQLPNNWLDMPKVIIDDPTIEIDTNLPWPDREASVRQKYATYMNMRDFFLTEYTTGIDVKNCSNVKLLDNNIKLYAFGIQVRGNSSNITINENRIAYCYDGIFSWDPIPSISDSVIQGNTVRQCFNNGMQIRQGADNVLIAKNDVRFSGTAHITILNQVTNCTIKNNKGFFGGYYTETMESPGSSAINIHTSNSGNVVDGNFAAFQVDVTGGDGNGFIVDLMLGEHGVLLKNNVAWRNMGSGIRTVESPNCVIANNTLAENGYNAVNPRAGAGVYLSREEDVQQTIVNNIFFDNPVCGIKSFFTIEDQQAIDHNLYFGPGPLIWDGWEFDENVYESLTEIQSTLGFEGNGVVGNPQFVGSPTSPDNFSLVNNFYVREASPAIDAGMPLTFVPEDFNVRPRPAGKGHDIGAFERQ